MKLPGIHFRPRLLDVLPGYNRQKFFADLSAGLTVGVVALPLAMAFAIASGVKPEAGLFTAIIAGFLISALGGSRVQIGGPAGAFIVVVYGIIERYGLSNLLIATILAGVLLFAMGFFKAGNLIRYIPIGVVIGFTNGIAVLIGVSQLKPFLGLQTGKLPADFFEQLHVLWQARATADLPTITLAALSLLFLLLWQSLGARTRPTDAWRMRLLSIPGPILVLVVGTAVVSLLHLPIETIGTRFGGIPQGLPGFALPAFSWGLVKQLFAPIITIAMLSAIESLLCARVADTITGERHDPNQELMAQGIANVITPFFGGIPATGTIARTVTNIRAGATSPFAGIIHAVVLLVVILFAAPLANNIPLASLAAILAAVALKMGEWSEFRKLRQYTVQYRTIMVGTFLLTVIFDLTVAVEAGIILACLFFIYRISKLTHIEPIADQDLPAPLPEGARAYHVFGSLFFGAVSKIEALSSPHAGKVIILEMHQAISLDTTVLDALETLQRAMVKYGGTLILCGANPQPASLIHRSGFAYRLGEEYIVSNLTDAIHKAEEHLSHIQTP